jgi:hypothetical protein
MVPCDFSLFPQFKNTLKCKQFENVEMIKLNAMQQLLEVPQQSMRGLLALEEPMEYVQPSRMDILQGELVNLKAGSVFLVSQCQSEYFFIWPHTHEHANTHTHKEYKIPRDRKSCNYVNLSNSVHCDVFKFLENVLQLFVF